jgi:hypothetical protein
MEFPIGYITTGKPTKEYLDIYAGLKDKNIDRIVSGKGTGRIAMLEKHAVRLLGSPLYAQARNKNEKLFVVRRSFEGLTTGEQDQIMAIADLISRRRRVMTAQATPTPQGQQPTQVPIQITTSNGKQDIQVGGVSISDIVQASKPIEQVKLNNPEVLNGFRLKKFSDEDLIKAINGGIKTQVELAKLFGVSQVAVSKRIEKLRRNNNVKT